MNEPTVASIVVWPNSPSYSVPAHNRPLDPDERERIKADYAAFREVNKLTPTAIGGRRPSIEQPALAVPEDERRAEYEARSVRRRYYSEPPRERPADESDEGPYGPEVG